MSRAEWLAWSTVAMTIVLIGVGVLVRATGSGLGCPDWPTCHGGVVPPEGNREAAIEMSHRLVASIVGFMVIAVAIVAWRCYRGNSFVLWTALLTVPLVGFQGILGAITVVRELPPEIVATHLLTAMFVLSFESAAAVGMSLERRGLDVARVRRAQLAFRSASLWAVAATIWLAVTLWVGGYMTESGATTACSGWPLCNGSVVPAADDQEVTHMLHRYLAGSLGVFIVGFALAAWKTREEFRGAATFAVAAVGLYALQVAVGALNIWLTFPDPLTILHTVIASLVWFTLSTAVIATWYVPMASRRQVGQLARGEVPA
jgi:heme A synthase